MAEVRDNNITLWPSPADALQLFQSQSVSAPKLSSEATLAMASPGGDTIGNLKHSPLDTQHNLSERQPSQLHLASNPERCSEASRPMNTPVGNSNADLENHPAGTQLDVMEKNISLSNPCSTYPWPKTLPVEVFHHIAKYLARTDLKACLETRKDFNRKFGPSFFQQVVLQFDTETFDEVTENDAAASSGQSRVPKLHMFENWGAHMKKVGFALEVDEGKQHFLLIPVCRC